MVLYKEDGSSASFWDLIDHWLENYPLEVMVKFNYDGHLNEVVEISKLMGKIKGMRK